MLRTFTIPVVIFLFSSKYANNKNDVIITTDDKTHFKFKNIMGRSTIITLNLYYKVPVFNKRDKGMRKVNINLTYFTNYKMDLYNNNNINLY